MGTTVFTLAGAFGLPQQLDSMFGGAITTGNTVVPVPYPNYDIFASGARIGGDMLNSAIVSCTDDLMIAFGFSFGAVACCNWLHRYGPTSAVDTGRLSFLLAGNSVNPYGGFCKLLGLYPESRLPANGLTRYSVVNFSRQYDGWADWPSSPSMSFDLSPVAWDAVMNGLCGQRLVHPQYENVSLEDPTNVSYVVGDVTYTWSMTEPVPLLGTAWTPATQYRDDVLRPIIESAYNRPVTMPLPSYVVAPPSGATHFVFAPSAATRHVTAATPTVTGTHVVAPSAATRHVTGGTPTITGGSTVVAPVGHARHVTGATPTVTY